MGKPTAQVGGKGQEEEMTDIPGFGGAYVRAFADRFAECKAEAEMASRACGDTALRVFTRNLPPAAAAGAAYRSAASVILSRVFEYYGNTYEPTAALAFEYVFSLSLQAGYEPVAAFMATASALAFAADWGKARDGWLSAWVRQCDAAPAADGASPDGAPPTASVVADDGPGGEAPPEPGGGGKDEEEPLAPVQCVCGSRLAADFTVTPMKQSGMWSWKERRRVKVPANRWTCNRCGRRYSDRGLASDASWFLSCDADFASELTVALDTAAAKALGVSSDELDWDRVTDANIDWNEVIAAFIRVNGITVDTAVAAQSLGNLVRDRLNRKSHSRCRGKAANGAAS
jgi:hypothetical protein